MIPFGEIPKRDDDLINIISCFLIIVRCLLGSSRCWASEGLIIHRKVIKVAVSKINASRFEFATEDFLRKSLHDTSLQLVDSNEDVWKIGIGKVIGSLSWHWMPSRTFPAAYYEIDLINEPNLCKSHLFQNKLLDIESKIKSHSCKGHDSACSMCVPANSEINQKNSKIQFYPISFMLWVPFHDHFV